MRDALTAIGLDADDTLWHNERFFRLTQDRFTELLADYTDRATLDARLVAAERRNIGQYGFGVKGFVLSMIETAIEVTDERVPARVIAELIRAGQEMLNHPLELLPGVLDAVGALADHYPLILITKGDLMHQERKLAQSGLGDLFRAVEIVSDKHPATYAAIFARHGSGADRGLMAGNSMKSDVLPMIAAGGWGVHIPHGPVWDLDHADEPAGHPRFAALDRISDLPALVERLAETA